MPAWSIAETVAFYSAAVVALPQVQALAEALLAPRRLKQAAPEHQVSVSIIIPAYLPNEDPILLGTIARCLAVTRSEDVEILVAYNSPYPHPLELVLQRAADADPRLVAIRVDGSQSKAENLNAALCYAKHDIVAIFDADAIPAADAIQRGARAVQMGADIVQGASYVSDGSRSILASVSRGEQVVKHFVSYNARYSTCSVAYFTGSNGYWRRSILQAHPFDPTQFTEDVDASLRARRNGANVVYDPTVVARDLAAPDIRSWLRQRQRWAAGWRQVATRQELGPYALADRWRGRLVWATLLYVRRVVAPLAFAALTVAAFFSAFAAVILMFSIALIPLLVGAVQAVKSAWVCPRVVARSDLVCYVAARPLIEVVTLGLAGLSLVSLPRTWHVTPRPRVSAWPVRETRA